MGRVNLKQAAAGDEIKPDKWVLSASCGTIQNAFGQMRLTDILFRTSAACLETEKSQERQKDRETDGVAG